MEITCSPISFLQKRHFLMEILQINRDLRGFHSPLPYSQDDSLQLFVYKSCKTILCRIKNKYLAWLAHIKQTFTYVYSNFLPHLSSTPNIELFFGALQGTVKGTSYHRKAVMVPRMRSVWVTNLQSGQARPAVEGQSDPLAAIIGPQSRIWCRKNIFR